MTDYMFDFHVLYIFCAKQGKKMNNKLFHFGWIDELMHDSHSKVLCIFNIYSHELNYIGATKVPVIDLNYICTHLSKFLCFRLKHLQTKTG